MSDSFEGTVALVTGGVSGIGAAVTRRLVDQGAHVLAVDINEDLVRGARESFGPKVVGHVADVTNESSLELAFDAAEAEWGRPVKHTFNIAGGARPGSILEVSYEDWDFTIRLNLYSSFLGTRIAARRLVAAGSLGTVVNVASLNSLVPMHGGAGYTASKAGVAMLGKQAALELTSQGIRVNTVSPGLVATPLTASMRELPGVDAAYMERIPAGRPAEPAEIAAAAVFLASDDASYIFGHNLVVDGGWATTGYPDLRELIKR